MVAPPERRRGGPPSAVERAVLVVLIFVLVFGAGPFFAFASWVRGALGAALAAL